MDPTWNLQLPTPKPSTSKHRQNGSTSRSLLPVLQEQGTPIFFSHEAFVARMCGVGNVFSPHPTAFPLRKRGAVSRRERSVFRVANHHRLSSRTPSLGSTVVSPTRRSGSTISAASARPSTTSPSASTSSPTNMSSWAPRLSRPLVSAPTSESPPRLVHDDNRKLARTKF